MVIKNIDNFSHCIIKLLFMKMSFPIGISLHLRSNWTLSQKRGNTDESCVRE